MSLLSLPSRSTTEFSSSPQFIDELKENGMMNGVESHEHHHREDVEEHKSTDPDVIIPPSTLLDTVSPPQILTLPYKPAKVKHRARVKQTDEMAQPPAPLHIPSYPFVDSVPADTELTVRLSLSYRDSGSIIGAGGANIQRLRTIFNTRIEVEDPLPSRTPPPRIVHLAGKLENCTNVLHDMVSLLTARATSRASRAARRSWEKGADVPVVPSPSASPALLPLPPQLNGPTAAGPSGVAATPISLTIVIPRHHLGAVIGRSGALLRETRQKTRAHVDFEGDKDGTSTERNLLIIGTELQVKWVCRRVLAQLAAFQSSAAEIHRKQSQRVTVKVAPLASPTPEPQPQDWSVGTQAPPPIPPPQYDPLLHQLSALSAQMQHWHLSASHAASLGQHYHAAACHAEIVAMQQMYGFLLAQFQFRYQQEYQQQQQQQQQQQKPKLSPAPQPFPVYRRPPSDIPATRCAPMRLQLPSNLLGHVIGEKGTTIEFIRRESGARIQLQKRTSENGQNGTNGNVLVKKTAAQIVAAAEAKAATHSQPPDRDREEDDGDRKSQDSDDDADESTPDETSINMPPLLQTLQGQAPLSSSRLLVISGNTHQVEHAANLIAQQLLHAQPELFQLVEASDTFPPGPPVAQTAQPSQSPAPNREHQQQQRGGRQQQPQQQQNGRRPADIDPNGNVKNSKRRRQILRQAARAEHSAQ